MADRFITPGELPTPHEREILTVLIEECAEVQQRATKMLRFGRDEVQPGRYLSNKERLGDEIGDLLEMIDRCSDLGLISPMRVEAAHRMKAKKLAKYLQTDAPASEGKEK